MAYLELYKDFCGGSWIWLWGEQIYCSLKLNNGYLIFKAIDYHIFSCLIFQNFQNQFNKNGTAISCSCHRGNRKINDKIIQNPI